MAAPAGEEQLINERLKELRSLVEQRELIQTRITKIETIIRALIDLLDDKTDQKIYGAKLAMSTKPVGLTEVIKHVLREGGKLTPAGVRDKLVETGFPLAGYANPFAVVYTTLSRLHDQGLIRKTDDGEYEWVTPKGTTTLGSLLAKHNAPLDPDRLPPAIRDAVYGPRSAITKLSELMKDRTRGKGKK
jgi:DNA-binding PadR family transcriptional regulator